jgi:hypothetical protein
MLVQILDGEGLPHNVSWQGQDQINDMSGALVASQVGQGSALTQIAPANAARAGWLFQNTSANAMLLNEVNATTNSSWVVNPGGFFPPPGYPIPVGIISVMGTATSAVGDAFAYREWINAPNE